MFVDRCRCEWLRQVLALPDQSMPLHDTGEQAGSGPRLSLSSTKIRNLGRRHEAHHVRRRNENARKSVSRKVSRVFTNISIIFVALTVKKTAVVDEGREYFCAIAWSVQRLKLRWEILIVYTRFHNFGSRPKFFLRFERFRKELQRIENYLDLVKSRARNRFSSKSSRLNRINNRFAFKHFPRPVSFWSLSPVEGGNIRNFQRSKTLFLPYYKKHVLHVSQTSIRNYRN